jgi:tetratricopeptide (TPR) repeat protein
MPPVVNQTTNAIEKYQAAVRDNPKSAEAHANLGWGYYGKEQYPEALKSLQEALALDPNLLEARYALALVYRAMNSKAEAIAEFEKVLALADQVDNTIRRHMLKRLVRGHISQINTGDWQLGAILQHG